MINNNITASQIELENQQYLTKVFGWMFTGLITTAIVSHYVASYIQQINPILFFVAIGLEFFLVYRIVRYVMTMTVNMATLSFILYSALNGFTLSGLFYTYTRILNNNILDYFIHICIYGILWLHNKKRFNWYGKFYVHGSFWNYNSIYSKFLLTEFNDILCYIINGCPYFYRSYSI